MMGEDELLNMDPASDPAEAVEAAGVVEAFDETTIVESMTPPWEDTPAVVEETVSQAAIQPVQPDDEITSQKLELCGLIEEAEAEITVVDEEIAELSTQLKAAKKLRESKIEEMRELVVQLRSIDRGLPLFDVKPQPPRSSKAKEKAKPAAAPVAVRNPWDQWEQGQAISLVRVLVPTKGVDAGAMLRTFDVEPPQVDGDSLTGIVKAYRLNSTEIVELEKSECSPVLPGVEEAPIGQRIRHAKDSGESQTADSDSWKHVSIASLDLPSSIVEILTEDNSIGTIGELAAFTTWNRLTDLKKIGESKADKIEEALGKFWASR
jgi:hypothetical protein